MELSPGATGTVLIIILIIVAVSLILQLAGYGPWRH